MRPFFLRLFTFITTTVLDSLVIVLAYSVTFFLRFDFNTPRWGWETVLYGLPALLLTYWIALTIFRCPKIIWRYISLNDVPLFVGAVGSALGFQLLFRVIFSNELHLYLRPPISVALMTAILSLFGLLAIRFTLRLLLERNLPVNITCRSLVFGAGTTGAHLVREAGVVAFFDDNPSKKGSRLHGIPIIGGRDQIIPWSRKLRATDLIVATSEESPELLKALAIIAVEANLTLRKLPKLSEWSKAPQIRPVDVNDLLGRHETQADPTQVLTLLSGRAVMITGAGGSIGSEIVRQVYATGPSILILVEQNESALYEINREMHKVHGFVNTIPILANCGCKERMHEVLQRYKPEIIIHAAAYKHVPMMELNPIEALRNNVLASRTLGELAVTHDVKRFILISTDKAVRPTSIMGLSKRLTEIAIRSLNGKGNTLFSMVRFGNVLDSSGSVVPLFREQIATGGPLTVTHCEMRRYFMTISEAVSLVLQAAAMAQGGEIFILDMGKPIRILELAETMITLSGLRPYQDIDITFTGIRPGEKLFEELDISEENTIKTGLSHIFIGKIDPIQDPTVHDYLQQCQAYVDSNQALTSEEMRIRFKVLL